MHAPAATADPETFPEPCLGLEEAAASDPRDWPQVMAFALSRAAQQEDARALAIVTPRRWRLERGEPFARGMAMLGLAPARLVLVRVEREIEALWALEEALKSGAVSGAVAAVELPTFLATRRLDFAARAGRSTGVLLRLKGTGDLSAARARWRISAAPSAPHPYDPRAPGPLRLRAELTRRRDGPLGAWILEQDHETHRLRLAAGLAGDGLVQDGRAHAA